MSTKSLWNEITNRAAGAAVDAGDLLLIAKQPGTAFTTQATHATVAAVGAVFAPNVQTYTPVVKDGAGLDISAQFDQGLIASYQVQGDGISVSFCLESLHLTNTDDLSELTISLPSFVTSVSIPGSTELFGMGMVQEATTYRPFQIGLFDTEKVIHCFPVWSVTAITNAIASTAVDFADSVVFKISGFVPLIKFA